jgi:hypothetical protein
MSLNILHVATPLTASSYLSSYSANIDWLPDALRERGHRVTVWTREDPVAAIRDLHEHDFDAIHLHLEEHRDDIPTDIPRLLVTWYRGAEPCPVPWVALSRADIRRTDQWPAAVIAPAIDADAVSPSSDGDELVMAFDGSDFYALSAAVAVARRCERPIAIIVPSSVQMTDEAAELIDRSEAILRVVDAGMLWTPDSLGEAACYLSFGRGAMDMGALTALAAGLPVITFDGFPAAELIVHGESGYAVRSIEEACSAVERLKSLTPRAGRVRARTLFDARAAAMRHEALYEQLRGGERPIFRDPETGPERATLQQPGLPDIVPVAA